MTSMGARSANANQSSSDEIISETNADLDVRVLQVGQTLKDDEKVGLHSTKDDKRELSAA